MANKTPMKPYPDFPLFHHANGQWAKKIKGKLHYFGAWSDPKAAGGKYLDVKDDLQAGRIPRTTPADTCGVTMRELANRFLTSKKIRLDTDDLSQRMFNDYFGICERILDEFGRNRLVSDLRSEDFEKLRAKFAKGVAATTLGNLIRLVRVVFKFAYDADLIDKPIKMGPGFKPPSRKTLRAARQAKPLRLFEASDLRLVIEAAPIALKAMTLLGINCGYGNTDCAKLQQAAIDFEDGLVTYPRPKTAVMRKCPLWPETVEALKAAIAKRPKAKRPEFEGLVFLTRCGLPWVRPGVTGSHIDSLASEFVKITTKLGINRENLTFYGLRHTVETIGGDAKDQPALDFIMGHAPHASDMSAVYRERIDDDRLKAVVDHVRAWLWPETIQTKKITKRPVKKTAVVKEG